MEIAKGLSHYDSPSRRVLLIEDDPYWQVILSRALRGGNPKVSVLTVASGEQAQEMLRTQKRFDLVVADHFLEDEITGIGIWKELKSQGDKTPFFIISGMSAGEFSDMMSDETAIPGFLSKKEAINELPTILGQEFGVKLKRRTTEKQRFTPLLMTLMLSFAAVWFTFSLTQFVHSINPFQTPAVSDTLMGNENGITQLNLSPGTRTAVLLEE